MVFKSGQCIHQYNCLTLDSAYRARVHFRMFYLRVFTHATPAFHHPLVNIWRTTLHYTDSCQTLCILFYGYVWWRIGRKFCIMIVQMPPSFEQLSLLVKVFCSLNPDNNQQIVHIYSTFFFLNDSHFPSNRASAIRLHLTPLTCLHLYLHSSSK